MPTHPVHNAHDVLILHCKYKEYDFVHKYLDTVFVKMFEEEHREILHDQETVGAIGRQFGPVAGFVAMNHIFMDSPTRYVDSEAMNGRLVRKKRGNNERISNI